MASPLTGPMQENEVPLTVTAQGTSGIDSKQSGKAKASQIAQPHQLRRTIFSEISIQLRIRIRMNQYPSVRHHRSRCISFSLWSWGPRRPRQSVPSKCVHWIRLAHVHRIDDSTIRRSGWRRAKGAAGSERNKARAARDSELPSIQNSSVYPRVFSIPNRVAWTDWHSERKAPDQSWLGWLRRSKFFKRCRRVRISKFFAAVNLSLWQQVQHCLLLLHIFSLSSPQKSMIKRFLQSIWSKVCDKSCII